MALSIGCVMIGFGWRRFVTDASGLDILVAAAWLLLGAAAFGWGLSHTDPVLFYAVKVSDIF
jgi:hypothetical protein